MYGLSKDEDLSFLIGRELQQVCVGNFQVILNFDNQTSINIECEFSVRGTAEHGPCEENRNINISKLFGVLGHRVVGLTNKGDGDLEIKFSDGSLIAILDADANIESYTISDPNHMIII